MNIEFTDGAQTWHAYVDANGELHDEPVKPQEQPEPEPAATEDTH